MAMNGEEVLKECKAIRQQYELRWKAIDRKRSWRRSEKAMAKADCALKLEALDRVIAKLLNETTNQLKEQLS